MGSRKSWSRSNGRASSGETSNANEATATPATIMAPIRSVRRGRIAETIASAAARANSPPPTGCSSVCHPVVISNAGRSASSADLPMRYPALGAAERRLQIVAAAEHGDGDSGALEAENRGIGAHGGPAAAGEAACVHERDGDLLPGSSASYERLDERRSKGRGDDCEVSRVSRCTGLAGEDRLDRPAAVLLGDGEDLERPRPVSLVVTDGHRFDAGVSCHLETRVTPAPRVRPHERPGGAHLGVEARGARRAGAVAGLCVEHDDDLVSRRVLELLDHQLVSARGRGPVHAAERLAALVLAHAVQLESGGAPEEDPSSPVRT